MKPPPVNRLQNMRICSLNKMKPPPVNKVFKYPYKESLYESLYGFLKDSLYDSIRNPYRKPYGFVGSRGIPSPTPIYIYISKLKSFALPWVPATAASPY